MIKIAVLVSGGGTNLQALIDAQSSGAFPEGEITLVLASNQKAYALERAKSAGIETAVISRKSFEDPAQYDQTIVKTLRDHRIDLVVLAGFLSILGKPVIDAYPERILNIHPSLIPSFCGAGFYGLRVHQAALDYGVKVTGATVHLVNEIPDGGRILLQKAVEIKPGDTPEILQRRVMEEAEWKILPQAVAMLCRQMGSTQDEKETKV
jgi:phosphoribosylglycinamide formyltransferase-1